MENEVPLIEKDRCNASALKGFWRTQITSVEDYVEVTKFLI